MRACLRTFGATHIGAHHPRAKPGAMCLRRFGLWWLSATTDLRSELRVSRPLKVGGPLQYVNRFLPAALAGAVAEQGYGAQVA